MGKKKNKHKSIKITNSTSLDNYSFTKLHIKYNIGVFVLFAFCVFLIYSNSLNSPFIWDDQYLIKDNHLIVSFKYLPEIFKHHLYYSTAGISNFYRPLQTFFLMIDYSLWKTNQIGYHITNILFHLLCGFFIYLLINLLFRKRNLAILVGLLFLIHPVNSTVVDYISSRADSQVTLFSLISLYLFSKSILGAEQNKDNIYYIGSIFSFILALLSKELAVIIPFLIMGTLVIIIEKRKAILKKIIPFLILLVIYISLRLTILNFATPVGGKPPSLYIRLLTSAESFVRLIGLLFIPSRIHIEKKIPFSHSFFQSSTFASIIILVIIFVFMFKIKKHSKMCFFGLSWFFISLLPMANIVPINATIADHWLYLPCSGFFLTVIALIYYGIEHSHINRALLAKLAMLIFIVVFITFSFLTVKQNNIWKDPLKFYQLALKYTPDSYRAHNEIGVIYLGENKYDLAIEEFKKSIAINPRFDQAYDNLGVAYDKSGNLKEAIQQHKKALELSPYNAKIYNNLGNAYNKLNKFDKAIEAYKNALKLNPDYKAVYNNIGVIYFKQGKYDQAREYWQNALKIDPNFKLVKDNLEVLKRIQK